MFFCSFDIRQANSGTAETPVEFQSEWKNVYTDLAPSSLKDILQLDILCDIETVS